MQIKKKDLDINLENITKIYPKKNQKTIHQKIYIINQPKSLDNKTKNLKRKIL